MKAMDNDVMRDATRDTKPTPTGSRAWMILLAIWLFALLLRLGLSQLPRVVWGDEPFYLWLGRNWVTGRGFAFVGQGESLAADVHHGPLFPMMAGVLYLVLGNLELASELLYALFGSLLVLPVYGMGRLLADDGDPDAGVGLGLAAAALTAVLPALTAATLHWGTMTEPIYMFFVYLGLWAALRTWSPAAQPDSSPAAWLYALAGVSFGLAYLTRPEAIGYVALTGVVMVVLHLWRGWSRASARVRGFWLKLGLYGLGFALCFLPYAYYVRQQTGAWMVSQKVGVAYLTGIGLAYGDTGAFDRSTWGLDSTGLETFFFSAESHTLSMAELILADPGTFVRVLVLNVQRFVQVLIDWTLLPYALLPVVGLGLFARGWSRRRTIQESYLILSMAPVLSFILFFIQARYIVAVMPVFMLWAARGLIHLGDWLMETVAGLGASPGPRWRWALNAAPVVAVVAVLFLAHPRVLGEVTSVGSVRLEHRTVGEQLAPLVQSGPDGENTVIMARYPAIAFHAGARWVPTPNASWAEVLVYARHKGVDYWAIDERELPLRPQFGDLMTAERLPPELEVVISTTSSNAGWAPLGMWPSRASGPVGERLVVYRLSEGN
jgi:hypothetical protein